MHCPHCQQPMNQTEEIVERHIRQTWHECPACGLQHTVSERSTDTPDTPRRIGERYRFTAVPLHLTEQA